MSQTGFQGVKQDEINCGHLNPVESPHLPFYMVKSSSRRGIKVKSINNKLHLTQKLCETCHPDLFQSFLLICSPKLPDERF